MREREKGAKVLITFYLKEGGGGRRVSADK